MYKVSMHSLWVVSAINPRAIPQPLTDSPSCGPGFKSHQLVGWENLGRKRTSEWALRYGL